MSIESLGKVFTLLDEHEESLRGELKQIDSEEYDDNQERSTLKDEIQRQEKDKALEMMQGLERLDRQIELRKRMRRVVERSLEELGNIRSELKQMEFRERITEAEQRAEKLRKKRELIEKEQIPEIEQRRAELLQERGDIEARLLNMNEEISQLRRRTKNVLKRD